MAAIQLPQGQEMQVDEGTTIGEVAARIGSGLAKSALAAKFNGELVDLRFPINEDGSVEIVTDKYEEALEVVRHSTAHLMAQAVKELYPQTQVTIGPAIDTGFYYDFDAPVSFNDESLQKIEQRMQELAQKDFEITREELARQEAVERFRRMGEHYKVELLEEMPEDTVSIYHQGEFQDLCRGPHVPSTGKLKAFKLLSVAGAYWRGDENNKMLQRIYGTAFTDKKELKRYLQQLEEARKRDHRKLGKELDLFSFQEEAPAMPFFHPNGAFIYNNLIDYIRSFNTRYEFQEVVTPQILDVSLWHRSGHYDNYKENMYFSNIDEREYAVKPMNCPTHVKIFGNHLRSYRNLPVRYSDFGRVHRYEKSGAIAGLFRVRSFAQDDAHVFCTPQQISREISRMIEMIFAVYKTFGFDTVLVRLATKPDKSIGSQEMWQKAESALEEALQAEGIDYKLNPGDGAFYGPKIDFKVLDAIGRQWQLGTIQLDFSMPERFGVSYVDHDQQEKTPVMIHRAILGSVERFFGILIEHYGGKFPVWLAPEQVRVIPVSHELNDYAQESADSLRGEGLRVTSDTSDEKMNYKIRQAQLQKIPYMVILGEKEREARLISVRTRDGQQKNNIPAAELVELIHGKERTNDLTV
jgi:threonyl-tRNA synthetase